MEGVIRRQSAKSIRMSDSKKALVQPVNVMFRHLQTKEQVEVWLFDNKHIRMEGVIRGFDEYMNLVLDQVFEVNYKNKTRQDLGMILLKGDCVSLIRSLKTES